MICRLVACLFILYANSAFAAKHAFILGNATYENLPGLENTLTDAAAYSEAFTQLGYDTHYHENLGQDKFGDEFESFLNRIVPGDQVTFVYAGHGWSDGTVNYLIPIDAPLIGSDRKLKRVSVALRNGYDGLLDQIEATGVSLTIAIIDACRNNPFKPLKGTRSLSMTRGLARVQPATGTFVIFSAGVGQEALDRLPEDTANQKLSVFTRSFIPRLTSGQYLEDAISEAQVETARLAKANDGHIQQPAYYDATLGKTCLSKSCSNVPSQTPADIEIERVYKTIADSENIEILKVFIKKFPESIYSNFVAAKIKQLKAATQRPKNQKEIARLLPKRILQENSGIKQRAFLYEESKKNGQSSRNNATIVWTLVRDLPSRGAPADAVIKGRLDIADKTLSMVITLKRNTDERLPASHIIELNFNGGEIDHVSRFVMKSTEQARGEGLVAVPAKLDNSNFLIALNNLPQAVVFNTKLLLESNWIDIPLGYVTGRRALITLEKGVKGREVFRDAVEEWKNQIK